MTRASEIAYFQERLRDPKLLRKAVFIPSVGLAVPLNETRLAGYLSTDSRSLMDRTVKALKSRNQFSNLCVEWRRDADSYPNYMIRWGVELPSSEMTQDFDPGVVAAIEGLLYGYKYEMIVDCIRTHCGGEGKPEIDKAAKFLKNRDPLFFVCL